jgi:DNA primase
MVALCPFHADSRRPNMVIYTDEQRFYCFACGSRGDVVDMAQHLDRHPDFISALRSLADHLGIEWQDPRDTAIEASPVLTLAAKLYSEQLTGRALAYLNGRGFPEAFVRKWRTGYAPPHSPRFLHDALRRAGVTPEAECASGVVVTSRDDREYARDFFGSHGGGYLIFANLGRRDAVQDLQGRAFPEAPDKPKYLNLPRSRRHLFNEVILPNATVMLTEGIPDALSCMLVDVPALAVYGTGGLSNAFVNRFTRCRRVYVALDLDAHDRSINLAMTFGVRGRVLVLPDRLGRKGDLNDLLVQLGPEQFRSELHRLMATAETGYAMAINRLPDDIQVTDLFETVAPLLAAVGALDPVSRDAHLQFFHVKYGVSMDTLRDAAREALVSVPSTSIVNGSPNSLDSVRSRRKTSTTIVASPGDSLLDIDCVI